MSLDRSRLPAFQVLASRAGTLWRWGQATLALGRGGPHRSPLAGLVPHRPRGLGRIFPHTPFVIGHRGAAGLGPENTLGAMVRAASLGVGFEIDVTTCASGELVVMHDDSLDRTTSGSGLVADRPLSYISKLDAGGGEAVPTLTEVLETLGGQVVIDIEIKSEKPRAPIAEKVARAVMQAKLTEQVVVTSFDPFVLEQLRRVCPEIRRGQLFGTFADADLEWFERVALRNLILARRAQPDFLAIEHGLLDRNYVAALQALGYPVLAWTPNSAEDLDRALAHGVDGVITDRPDLALERLP